MLQSIGLSNVHFFKWNILNMQKISQVQVTQSVFFSLSCLWCNKHTLFQASYELLKIPYEHFPTYENLLPISMLFPPTHAYKGLSKHIVNITNKTKRVMILSFLARPKLKLKNNPLNLTNLVGAYALCLLNLSGTKS